MVYIPEAVIYLEPWYINSEGFVVTLSTQDHTYAPEVVGFALYIKLQRMLNSSVGAVVAAPNNYQINVMSFFEVENDTLRLNLTATRCSGFSDNSFLDICMSRLGTPIAAATIFPPTCCFVMKVAYRCTACKNRRSRRFACGFGATTRRPA